MSGEVRKMKALLYKAGMFLVVSSFLAAWTLLAAQPVQAQSPTQSAPSCPSSRSITNFDAGTKNPSLPVLETATVTIGDDSEETDDLSDGWTVVLDGDISAENQIDYFRVRVPELVMGELSVTVSDAGLSTSVARLCRRSSNIAQDAAERNEDPAHDHAAIPMVPLTIPDDYYIVVRAVGTSQGQYRVTVDFDGVMPTTFGTTASGSIEPKTDRDIFGLTISVNGLLTVETTGNTDTKGELLEGNTERGKAGTGGADNNFELTRPVKAGAYTVAVESEHDETGPYTLGVEFHGAVMPDLSLTGRTQKTAGSGDTDYFYFEIEAAEDGLLILETTRHQDQTAYTPTKGTLYGPLGLIAMDDNTAGEDNFKLAVPSMSAGRYIIQVEIQGRPGDYALEARTDAAETEEFTVNADSTGTTVTGKSIVAPPGGSPAQVDYYLLDVEKDGLLDVKTTGTTDTEGTLIGPDGREVARDDNSGPDPNNFRLLQEVTPGTYLISVAGRTRTTAGGYDLTVNFIAGVV